MDFQIKFETYLARHGLKSEAMFQAIKDDIVSGRLEADCRLPSSRSLAEQYGLSRGTVNLVYDRLNSQGYTYAREGSGTYVMHGMYKLAAHTSDRTSHAGVMELDGKEGEVELSTWGNRLRQQPLLRSHRGRPCPGGQVPIEFLLGRVDLGYFPAKEWNRLMYEQVRESYNSQLSNAFETEGYGPLREGIAQHLRRTRGVMADTDDVVIVNGSQQAITLLVQLSVNPGDLVAVENPHYLGNRRAILAAGGQLELYPVDREGMVFEDTLTDARLLLTTTGRQFPTGAILSMERRLRLLRWADQAGALIIEDDYDSEHRYKGRPLEPLKALDQADRVAFIGTFSRTMMQDNRLAYVVLPRSWRTHFLKAKQLLEPHPSSILEQRALAEFMSRGLYERHLRRMRRVYKRRHELLQSLLQTHVGELFDIQDTDGGLHLYARWKHPSISMDRYMALCEENGVRFVDCRSYHAGDPVPSACFGFAHLDEQSLIQGAQRLRAAADGLD